MADNELLTSVILDDQDLCFGNDKDFKIRFKSASPPAFQLRDAANNELAIITDQGASADWVITGKLQASSIQGTPIGSTTPAAITCTTGRFKDAGIAVLVGPDGDSTIKYGRVGSMHYAVAEEPIAMLVGVAGATSNAVYFGGGSSVMNAATSLSFFTAENNTTTSGTERMRIGQTGTVTVYSGNLDVGVAATTRGVVLVRRGAGGAAPGCYSMMSKSGTQFWLFPTDTGEVRIHSALPTADTDGVRVGVDLASPGPIGTTTPAAGTFTQLTATVPTGTAPLTVTSTTACPNLNSSLLLGKTWASPAAIGSTTPAAATFTTATIGTINGGVATHSSVTIDNALGAGLLNIGSDNVRTGVLTLFSNGAYESSQIVFKKPGGDSGAGEYRQWRDSMFNIGVQSASAPYTKRAAMRVYANDNDGTRMYASIPAGFVIGIHEIGTVTAAIDVGARSVLNFYGSTWPAGTNVTELTNGADGQIVIVRGGGFSGSGSFIDDNDKLRLAGDWAASNGSTLVLICVGASKFIEICRSSTT